MLNVEQMEAVGYSLNDAEVDDLLLTVKGADEITEAYSTAWFRVFLRQCQELVFGGYAWESALGHVDKHLYARVKAKVLPGITDPIERNRKTAFHRVAKHQIKKYFEAGMTTPAKTVTKAEITRAHKTWKSGLPTDDVNDMVTMFNRAYKRTQALKKQGVDITPVIEYIKTVQVALSI